MSQFKSKLPDLQSRETLSNIDEKDKEMSPKGPSLHTSYPAHVSKPVRDPAKIYENQWQTSLFYPQTVHAKAQGMSTASSEQDRFFA